jgi:carbamoyl-phosphate synthase large subunit
MYGTFEDEDEVPPADRPRVVVLGSGPNRIGQGIEFDYACVHAAFALRDAGYETVMVNCNPETVSTDYDTSDRLYFEPLTAEDVLAVVEAEQPEAVIVQLGGQTPLNLAAELEAANVPIAGTSPASIDLAEDREQFSAVCRRSGSSSPARSGHEPPRGPRGRRSGRPARRGASLVRARRTEDAGGLQLRRVDRLPRRLYGDVTERR